MRVNEYRRIVENLERVVNVDYHACIDQNEKDRWADIAKRVGSELINSECPRASKELTERAERVIDRSATRITKFTAAGKPQ